jgi:nucleotide-binding universal stress UspA family protein
LRPREEQEAVMYRKILVAFDGSPESRLAVDECAHLITVSGREIHLACVVHDPSPYLLAGEFVPEPALAVDRSRMEADLKEASARLTERGFSVTTHLEDGEPVEVISKLCLSLGIDLLIVGHRRTKKFAFRWWRGSIDSMLIDRVRCSILVAGDQPPQP